MFGLWVLSGADYSSVNSLSNCVVLLYMNVVIVSSMLIIFEIIPSLVSEVLLLMDFLEDGHLLI